MTRNSDWPARDDVDGWSRLSIAQLQSVPLDRWSSLTSKVLRVLEQKIYGAPLSHEKTQVDLPSYGNYQKRGAMTTRPTKRQLADAQADALAYPGDQPDSRWSDDQLAAYLAHQDLQLAEQPVTGPIRLEDLSDKQLATLASAADAGEAARLEALFATGQQERQPKRKAIRIKR